MIFWVLFVHTKSTRGASGGEKPTGRRAAASFPAAGGGSKIDFPDACHFPLYKFSSLRYNEFIFAGMMELVDMRDLGSRAFWHWGSTPHTRTNPI